MKLTLHALGVVAIGVMVLGCGGCSGVGTPAEQVRGAGIQATATDHLAAVLLVKSWFSVLYPEVGGVAPTAVKATECAPEINSVEMPDGSTHYWGTNSDCSTFDYLTQPDGSGSGTQTAAGGGTTTLSWSAPVFEGMLLTQTITQLAPDGTRLHYSLTQDFGLLEAPATWDGAITLTDGRTMQFVLDCAQGISDHLRLSPGDGSHLEVEVPMELIPEVGHDAPRYAAGARGAFTSTVGRTLEFTITGSGSRWDRWAFTASDGSTGAFALGPSMAGSGELRKEGSIIGALQWPATAVGTLYILAAGSEEVTPSAAARAFQIDRWISTIAALGPAPMY